MNMTKILANVGGLDSKLPMNQKIQWLKDNNHWMGIILTEEHEKFIVLSISGFSKGRVESLSRGKGPGLHDIDNLIREGHYAILNF